jgi:hypothetical protein
MSFTKKVIQKIHPFDLHHSPYLSGTNSVTIYNDYHEIPKQIKDLIKGDTIINSNDVLSKILCIIKIKVTKPIKILSINDTKMSPFYPLNINNKWTYAIDSYSSNKYPYMTNNYRINYYQNDYVYNFIVDNRNEVEFVTIDDINMMTLGHNITDNNTVYHDFFGTDEVVNYLKKYDGFDSGLIVLNGENDKLICEHCRE